ncbi:hypothetical protein GGQ80_003223 [Sphingomonas jinjuensis]|uniref:Uncharacterized protein n=1 Tax=Sphingomonas jinjuensis TaxID=535907 RepID=A0A840F7S8_9SPHN|nr:hypothetical protein [Sphingomonas jinjuensis]MBB4155303.1 hypothetical protein [Sphingomonas jinjuensis]
MHKNDAASVVTSRTAIHLGLKVGVAIQLVQMVDHAGYQPRKDRTRQAGDRGEHLVE